MFYLLSLLNLNIDSPVSIGIFTAGITMLYLMLMSINSYLPPILLLSYTVGHIVYMVQSKCNNPYYYPPSNDPNINNQYIS